MANRTEYELIMSLKAALGPNFQSTFNSANQEIRQMQGSMQDAKRTLGETSRQEADLRKAMKQTAATVGENSDEYRRLQSQLEATQGQKARLQQSIENVKRSQEELAQATQRVEENKRALKSTQRELVFTLGKIAGAGVALYAAFVRPSAQVEAQLSNVKANAGATAEEMERLADRTRDAWRSGFTRTQKANVFEGMAEAGWNPEQMKASYSTVLQIVDATGDGISSVTGVLKNTMQAFNASSSEAARFGDILVATTRNSYTNLTALGQTMSNVAPIASMFGFTLEDTAAMTAMLAENGIKGAKAGTALKNIINGVVGLTDTQAAAMHSLGVSAEYYDGSMRQLDDIMRDLRGAFGDLTQAQQASYAAAIAGQAGYAGLLAIINTSEADYNRLTEAIRYSEGAAASMAAIRMDNFHGQARMARAAIDEMRQSLGEQLLPIFAQGIAMFTAVITRVVEFTQANPELVRTIFMVVAALAALKVATLVGKIAFLQMKGSILGVKKVFAGFKAKKAAAELAQLSGTVGKTGGKFSKFGKIFKVVGKKLLPIILIVSVLAAVLGQLGGGAEKSGGFMETLQAIFAQIHPVLQTVMWHIGELAQKILPILIDITGQVISTLGQLLSSVLPVLISLFETLLPVLKELVLTVFAIFVDVLKALLPLFVEIVRTVLPILLDLIETLLPIIKELVMTVFAVFVDVLRTLLPVIKQLVEAVLPVLVSLIHALLPIITQLVSTVLPIFIQVLKALLPIISRLIEAILPVLMTLLQALMPVISVLAEIFTGVLGTAINSITEILSGVMRVLGGLIDFITGVFTGNWTKAWEGVKNIFGGIFETIGGLVRAPLNAVISLINSAISGINRLGISIPNWVPVIGGREFKINIPEIPMLAKGSNRSPDTFIAGEEGPELITGAKGRKVFTATETGDIFNKLKALGLASKPDMKNAATAMSSAGISKAAKISNPPSVKPPTVSVAASRGRNYEIFIENKIDIQTTGEAGSFEEKLKAAYEYLVELILDRIKKEEDDDGRVIFA